MSSCCRWPWENGTCPSNGTNRSTNSSVPTDSILYGMPTSVKTCAQALERIGDRLARKLHGEVYISVMGQTDFVMEVHVGREITSVNLSTSFNCKLPITCTYEKVNGAISNTPKMFGTVDQLLDYLVRRLRT